jgi:hypothetical protein
MFSVSSSGGGDVGPPAKKYYYKLHFGQYFCPVLLQTFYSGKNLIIFPIIDH